jgi:SAM-dependent methyltransferase
MKADHRPSGYDPKHFEKLLEVEDRHFWFASRNRLLSQVLASVELETGARVLEVGTGTGNTLRVLEGRFPAATIVGVDLFGEGLAMARRRSAAHLVRANIAHLPFRSAFDLIAAFDVLEHLEDDRTALTDIRGLLAPGGHLVLTVPAFTHLWSRFDADSHHFRRYELEELRERVEAAGLVVERLTFFMATLYPVLRVVRWVSDRMSDRASTSASVARELRIVPIVNPMLRWILTAEARLVARGAGPHIGTSLLAVARRDTLG